MTGPRTRGGESDALDFLSDRFGVDDRSLDLILELTFDDSVQGALYNVALLDYNLGDTTGIVSRIRIRATTVVNWDKQELLIPNKELITGRLLNWTLSDARTRILIQVGIAYGSNVDRAMEILLELARNDERVLKEPAPGVVFDDFGDNSLILAFRVFVGTLDDRRPVMTDMRRNILRRFAEEVITIAFPQRDMHFDADQPLRISLERSPPSGSK